MSNVLRIFRKDGLEVLRDRRTLFVNLILPLLLYPVIMLFMIQVLQLTQATPGAPTRIALIDAPGALHRWIEKVPADDAKSEPEAGQTRSKAMGPAKPATLEIIELPAADALRLRELIADAGSDPLDRSPEALAILRRNRLATAIVHRELPDQRHGLILLRDDANPKTDEVQSRVQGALESWRKELIQARLAAAGLPASVVAPLETTPIALAPPAESVRTRIAGMIPLLLVLLAASGAFYAAIDLIAGERERGTLETLLSLPVKRRDIFLGKLLVVCAAAGTGVVLNLLSLTASVALLGAQIPASQTSGVEVAGLFAVGGGTLLLCLLVLLPLTVTIAALALALAGLAQSAKEAQNYLTPMLLAVLVAAGVGAIPGTAPNLALDLIPITGAVLALKDALQSPRLPWLHLAVATGASLVVAAVVMSWSARLLDSEGFRYPGLIRAGWGRFRRWGAAPSHPGGLEALGVYALAVAGMTLGAGFFAGAQPAVLVAAPLIAFIALPALSHAWLADLKPAAIGLRWPTGRNWAAALLLLPFTICLSAAIGGLQQSLVPKEVLTQGTEQVVQVIYGIRDQGGVVLLLICVAILPGICEELLCRGTLLSGLRAGLGPWGGALVTAFLFAILHLSPWRFAPQFVLGLLLALVVYRTRSVLPAMLIHAGHNGVLVLIELFGGKEPPSGPWLGAIAGLSLLGAAAAWKLSAEKR